jgi:hypothetical protein
MCFLANVNLEPLLVSPVEIEPTVPWLPDEQYWGGPTCVEMSESPAWTIDNLSYDHMTLGMNSDPSVPRNRLSFKLTNLANNVQLLCAIDVDETALDRTLSEQWINCLPPGPSKVKNIVSTTVMFNKAYNLLAVNQTWQCGGVGVLAGYQYVLSPKPEPSASPPDSTHFRHLTAPYTEKQAVCTPRVKMTF